ncbi:MAG: hypothetical protein LLG04_08430 [Parachlamydia sp.]|nr:hypothetical protein [Parachlamydia sp.]
MTRATVFAAMTAALLLHSGLSAQINNYYNAPYQYQLPGHPSPPGVTPFVGGTTQPVTYPYNTASSAVQPAGYPYNATSYGAQPYTTTSTYATPGTAAPVYPQAYSAPGTVTTTTAYPQSYTVPGTATTTTTAYPQTYTAPTYGTSAYSATNANYYPYSNLNYTATTGNVSTAFATPITATSQLYPQPAQPAVPYQPTAAYAPLAVPVPAYAEVAPPDFWSPGLATIKNGKWVVTDFLYNLSPNIGVKVQVVRPPNRYLPLSDKLIEGKLITQFQDALLNPNALIIPCQPPLPVYNVTIMAYPCGNRCVGVVTAQLYETARPDRIEADLAGVWQVVTWERQELVVSACEDFSQQIEMTITGMTQAFIDLYNRFNPIPTRPCFPQ